MPSDTSDASRDTPGAAGRYVSVPTQRAGGYTTVLNRGRAAMLAWLGPGQGITASSMVVLFVALLLLVLTHRPADLLHPVFYAEDGVLWYADAYNLHWARALFIPNASYLQLLPRLAVGPALWLPLRWAPLFLNLLGASLQVLPVLVLLSRRTEAWGPLPLRAALAAIYLASPNTREINVNITNAQWHLAFLEMLLVLGCTARGWFQRTAEAILFTLGALSGPFSFVLLPVLAIAWLQRRERWLLVLMACMVPGLLLQAHTMQYGYAFESLRQFTGGPGTARVDQPLGASPSLFVRIVGGCVFLDSMIGNSPLDRGPILIPLVFLGLGLFVVGCGMFYGSRALRLLTLFTVVLLAAAMHSPMIADPVSRWHGLSLDGGQRYYFFPMLVYLWSAAYTVHRNPPQWVRMVCLIPLCLLVLGLGRWFYKPFPPRPFLAGVHRFEQALPGEQVRIPINPERWDMILVKRP